MKIYDLSVDVMEGMTTFPGDPEFGVKSVLKYPKDACNLCSISSCLHAGTHIDAPSHIGKEGSVDKIPLDKCYGRAKVMDLTGIRLGHGIRMQDIVSIDIREGDIVLFKTRNSGNYEVFIENYVYLCEDAAAFLIDKKVKAVGIDYLSIDRYRSGLKVHDLLIDACIAIYEGLNMKNVDAGEYTFAGFPIRYKGLDGSPVRAVLIDA